MTSLKRPDVSYFKLCAAGFCLTSDTKPSRVIKVISTGLSSWFKPQTAAKLSGTKHNKYVQWIVPLTEKQTGSNPVFWLFGSDDQLCFLPAD